MSVLVSMIIVGILITRFGDYVPIMIVGQIIDGVATYFLSWLDVDTSTTYWAGLLFTAGWGLGMGIQCPYTAIQVVLSESDAIVGNAVVTMISQLGGAVTVSVGESIFVSTLLKEIPRRTDAISPDSIVVGVASNVWRYADDPFVYNVLRESFALAFDKTMIYSTIVASLAIPCAFGMEWLNVKKIAAERKARSLSTP